MRIAIIGRSELLYDTAIKLQSLGHTIPLVITAKEAPEYKRTALDFHKLAKASDAVFINTAKLNTPEIVSQISSIRPIDIAVSINFSGIISQNIIDLFKNGILNAHGGDLPRYRGNACQAWALINGEDRIGLCIHKMIGGELDSGPIIARDFLNVNIDTRIGQVYEWMNQKIPTLMKEAIAKLNENSEYALEVQSTDPSKGLRAYPRNPDDGAINWRESNENILRLINASSEPFVGAFSFMDDQKVIIWRASLEASIENWMGVPGQVASINSDGSITVLTGEGKLRLTDIETQGQRTHPKHFIKSIRKRFK